MWATVSYSWEMGSEMASLQLKVETERVLSPCYMHYTLFQWEYLHSLIVATVCFDTKKALLSYSPTRLEDTGKRTEEMGITLYKAGGATF